MIHFILMVNKQGQTRLAQYYFNISTKERITLEGELVRKCLGRGSNASSFIQHEGYKIVYRRYASLYFIVGLDADEPVSRSKAVLTPRMSKSTTASSTTSWKLSTSSSSLW